MRAVECGSRRRENRAPAELCLGIVEHLRAAPVGDVEHGCRGRPGGGRRWSEHTPVTSAIFSESIAVVTVISAVVTISRAAVIVTSVVVTVSRANVTVTSAVVIVSKEVVALTSALVTVCSDEVNTSLVAKTSGLDTVNSLFTVKPCTGDSEICSEYR